MAADFSQAPNQRPSPDAQTSSKDPFRDVVAPGRGSDLLARAPREIEIRYLVPPHLLSTIVGSRAPKKITQHYFPNSSIKELVKRFSVDVLVAGADTFTSARIRQTRTPNGERSYELEFKGPKQSVEGLRISRDELSVQISREQFKKLRKEATAGMIQKLRFEIEGEIRDDTGRAVPAIAQVDLVLRAGKPTRRVNQSYITADVELPEEQLIAPFSRGQHSFSFLAQCLDMGINGKKIRRHLSSTQVARYGLGKKQVAALAKAHVIMALRRQDRE